MVWINTDIKHIGHEVELPNSKILKKYLIRITLSVQISSKLFDQKYVNLRDEFQVLSDFFILSELVSLSRRCSDERWRWRYYVLWCSSPWKVQDVTKKFFLRSVKPGSRYYVILPDVMWCHVICSACSVWKRRWCHVMLCDFMWCWFMWCRVMFCDAAQPPSEWIGC